MGRDTSGVKGMNVPADAEVLDMEVAPDGSQLLVITENGYGKRTPIEEYSEHHRGGQGITTIAMTKKKGKLACMKVVKPETELMLISQEGIVIRVKASEISELGRATQGVTVMKVEKGDKVVAIATVTKHKRRKAKALVPTLDPAQQALFENEEEDDDDILDEVEEEENVTEDNIFDDLEDDDEGADEEEPEEEFDEEDEDEEDEDEE